jgi:hypothetical protein
MAVREIMNIILAVHYCILIFVVVLLKGLSRMRGLVCTVWVR